MCNCGERIRELERELRGAHMTVAAIIAKYGDRMPSAPYVRQAQLTDADTENAPDVVTRIDDPMTHAIAFRVKVRDE